jgi:Cof subfamily protein (haloacid dehalogenase superfamily)
MIALDLDDTLLRSDLSVSFYTRRIIGKAVAKEIAIVLASGRTPSSLLGFGRKLKLDKVKGFYIAENGALILNSMNGEVVERTLIPPKTAMTAYKLADAEGFSIQKYDGDVTYLSRRNEFTDYDQKLTGLRQEIVEDFGKIVEAGCSKLLIPGDPMILKPLEELFIAYIGDESTIFTSKPYFLEILPPNTDKGTALARIARTLGIAHEEVMAFGDSMNDAAMLRWAGVGVAMKNGDERIKTMARMISDRTNNDDGVAHIIEDYVLKNKAFP